MKNVEELVPEVESPFARLHAQLRNRERTLRMRVSELKAAERHIEQLEGKLLKLKQYRSELKLVKEQKKALQKSPERRIGQVLLAPYRLPERLIKVIWKKLFRRNAGESATAPSEYHKWLEHHRATPRDLDRMRRRSRNLHLR
jgi:hypothetical protein